MITRHEVVIGATGIPTPYHQILPLRQGSKNVDILSFRFENYNNAELVALIKATRPDGEKAPAGLMALPRAVIGTYLNEAALLIAYPNGEDIATTIYAKITSTQTYWFYDIIEKKWYDTESELDNYYWYDFTFGQQEAAENDGSWFTEVESAVAQLKINISLVSGTKTYVNSEISFSVEETAGFETGGEYTWDIIVGFLQALSLRATYVYVDNGDLYLQQQITSNDGDISTLQSSKASALTTINDIPLSSTPKQIILNSENINAKYEDNTTGTLQDVLNSKFTDIEETEQNLDARVGTLEGQNLDGRLTTAEGKIGTLEGQNLDGRLTTAEGEINTLQEEVILINGDLENVAFISELENGTEFVNVTSADDVSKTIDGTLITDIFEDFDRKQVKKASYSLLTNSAKNVYESIGTQDITNIFEEGSPNVKNSTNVTTNINGKAITSIFEEDGTTVKEATHSASSDEASNSQKLNNYNDTDFIKTTDTINADTLNGYSDTDFVKTKTLLLGQTTFNGTTTSANFSHQVEVGDILEINIEDNLYYIKINSLTTLDAKITHIFKDSLVNYDITIGGNTFWSKTQKEAHFNIGFTLGNGNIIRLANHTQHHLVGRISSNENDLILTNQSLTIKSIYKVN